MIRGLRVTNYFVRVNKGSIFYFIHSALIKNDQMISREIFDPLLRLTFVGGRGPEGGNYHFPNHPLAAPNLFLQEMRIV